MILVTGGAGFIGSNFILGWLGRTDEAVINLDLLTYAGNPANLAAVAAHPRYAFHRGDIGDQALVESVLQGGDVRAIVHFAAESHVDRSIHGPDAFVQTNVVGTFRLLEAARRHWQSLPAGRRDGFRFLHVSTDEVYGSLRPDAPPFRSYHHTYGLPVVTTNCSNNYGPYQFPEKLIPLCIHNALAGKPLPIYGDGRQIRDWLYVADHCTAIERVLADGRPGETYNIGGWNEQPNIDVVRSLCAILDEEQPRSGGGGYAEQITYVKDRPGHDRRYAIDARKIERELGWRPAETFATGIRKTIRWYLGHGDWVASVVSGGYREWVDRQYGQ